MECGLSTLYAEEIRQRETRFLKGGGCVGQIRTETEPSPGSRCLMGPRGQGLRGGSPGRTRKSVFIRPSISAGYPDSRRVLAANR